MFARLMNGCYRRIAIAATAALAIALVTALATPASAQYYPGYPYYSYYPSYPYYPYYPAYSYNPYYNPYYYPYYSAGYGYSYPYFGFPGVSLGFRFGGGFHHGGFRGFHH